LIRNHPDTVVFKLKDHVISDINSVVFDEMIKCFHKNKVCQALYLQNISRAVGDEQLHNLIRLLKAKKIWCLNIGENYNVSKKGWEYFCKVLPLTNITHLYVSEHIIHIDLKNKMRDFIRANRSKHTLHCSMKNIRVIDKCTHMWWNPINAIRHQLDAAGTFSSNNSSNNNIITKKKLSVAELTPNHTAYWAEGVGAGGNIPWKFNCKCGETCSSYENFRYHPSGRMYQCTRCTVWSHVECVLGTSITDDDIEELSVCCILQ
jgi:hypothetical protein